MTINTIRQYEELSLNEWPALQTVLLDGWVLRFAGGYTRRANSVNPIYEGVHDAAEKIAACEVLYARHNLKTTFKITTSPFCEPLDRVLADCGYLNDAYTSVQSTSITKLALAPVPNVKSLPLSEWLPHYTRLNEIKAAHQPILHQMMSLLIPSVCFMGLYDADQVVACGTGVVQNGYLGLQNIVTDASYRNRGFGRQIMSGLIAWGRENAAHTAYLSVMLNNAPALHLYNTIGFMEMYQYWYRVQP